MTPSYKYLYGPVFSWRLGMSLGVDPISRDVKVCNFNCVYCQLGETQALIHERKVFVPTKEILQEIQSVPPVNIDYITFSGRGEPTLAQNLGELITGMRKIRPEKIAVITNASLMDQRDVQSDLAQADFVLAKLDAASRETFEKVDRPAKSLSFEAMVNALVDFKKKFHGKFALQIMLIEENKSEAKALAALARKIGPDEVQINTPLRPSAASPLTKEALDDVQRAFDGLCVRSVYEVAVKKYVPFDVLQTTHRHGKFQKKENPRRAS